MYEPNKKPPWKRFKIKIDTRTIVGITGLLLSIVFHELFHIIMHWGDVTNLRLFSSSLTIAEVGFVLPQTYDLLVEEIFAYGITAVTILLTIKLVWEIHDTKDTRKVSDILSSKSSSSSRISTAELSKLINKK